MMLHSVQGSWLDLALELRTDVGRVLSNSRQLLPCTNRMEGDRLDLETPSSCPMQSTPFMLSNEHPLGHFNPEAVLSGTEADSLKNKVLALQCELSKHE